MKVALLIFLLKALITYNTATDNVTSNDEFYNPYNDEHSLLLWKNLFLKVNSILVETENINKKLYEQEKEMKTMMEKIEGMNVTLNKLKSETQTIQKQQQVQGAELKEVKKHIEWMNGVTKFNMELNNRNWTTILRRMDGSVNFYRNWTEYKAGFGNPPLGEFFIGLERLHQLTTVVPVVELEVTLKDWDDNERYAIYDGFQIGNEAEKYKLKLLGKYRGNAADCLIGHVGEEFSTFDNDNDKSKDYNCAKTYEGAWWFESCYYSHLAGPYRQKENANTTGIGWSSNFWKGQNYSFKYAEMSIRPKIMN
ncbi:ficolin-2-like [Musca autumnalis]|uniref:ficolin-2-like n=1 Tax=Musca autumnalis TaxID=221902 RepID=UPI003CEE3FA2